MRKVSVDNVLRMFMSRHTVKWENPVIAEELDAYFGSPEACEAFAKQGLRFGEERDLRQFLSAGRLSPIPDEILSKVANFAFSKEDLEEKLSDQTYSQAYKELEHKLEKGDLLLKAPIVVKFKDDSYWGFSGRKRAYVARKNGAAVLYFLVEQPKDDEGEKSEQDSEKEKEQEDKMESTVFSD